MLRDNDQEILRYIATWEPMQTYRIARHIGYRYADLASRHTRAMLKRLERHGYIVSDGNGSNVLFWSLTDKGREAVK